MVKKIIFYQTVTLVMTNTGSYVGWISHEGGHNRYTELETCISFENEYLIKITWFRMYNA
jgi:hypothetical protein